MGLTTAALACLVAACSAEPAPPLAPTATTLPDTPATAPSTPQTATPAASPDPTATQVETPTHPPISTSTVEATATPEPAASTPTPATPAPEASPSATTTPIPTATPEPPASPTATESPQTPTPSPVPTLSPAGLPIGTVIVGGASFTVEVASDSDSRSTGLSYRDSLDPDTGMLFLMPREGIQTFWMKEMRFPLDMVWIGADCRVTGVTHDVPLPARGTPDSELPRYRSPDGTLYVLEINAGLAAELGIGPGAEVTFLNIGGACPQAQDTSS